MSPRSPASSTSHAAASMVGQMPEPRSTRTSSVRPSRQCWSSARFSGGQVSGGAHFRTTQPSPWASSRSRSCGDSSAHTLEQDVTQLQQARVAFCRSCGSRLADPLSPGLAERRAVRREGGRVAAEQHTRGEYCAVTRAYVLPPGAELLAKRLHGSRSAIGVQISDRRPHLVRVVDDPITHPGLSERIDEVPCATCLLQPSWPFGVVSGACRSRRRPFVRGLELVLSLLPVEVDDCESSRAQRRKPSQPTASPFASSLEAWYRRVISSHKSSARQRLQSLGSGFGQDVAPTIVPIQPAAEGGPGKGRVGGSAPAELTACVGAPLAGVELNLPLHLGQDVTA